MRLLLVEEHKILRESIVSILQVNFPDIDIVTSPNGQSALNVINYELQFELLIINLQLSDIYGVDLIESIHQEIDPPPIIAMNSLFSNFLIKKLLKLNVQGFLNQYNSSKDLLEAIHAIRNKERYYSDDIQSLIDDFNIENQYIQKIKQNFIKEIGYTDREIEIIQHMMSSKTNKEIAEALFLSSDTIKFHRKNIYRKSNVGNLLDLYKLLNSKHFFYEPK
ncbi:MAG: response regulator transcription factor [Flavobacteriales bacterium]|jgi:DNA-binding NarL/FixJ family response regulator|nr:response regulator transcription factor [Flavobacteriales bacterium]